MVGVLADIISLLPPLGCTLMASLYTASRMSQRPVPGHAVVSDSGTHHV